MLVFYNTLSKPPTKNTQSITTTDRLSDKQNH